MKKTATAKPPLYILPRPEQWVKKCPRAEVCGMTLPKALVPK